MKRRSKQIVSNRFGSYVKTITASSQVYICNPRNGLMSPKGNVKMCCQDVRVERSERNPSYFRVYNEVGQPTSDYLHESAFTPIAAAMAS